MHANNVNSLLSENLPVFALDTCILLDIVQATDGIDSHRLSRQCKQDNGKTLREQSSQGCSEQPVGMLRFVAGNV